MAVTALWLKDAGLGELSGSNILVNLQTPVYVCTSVRGVVRLPLCRQRELSDNRTPGPPTTIR